MLRSLLSVCAILVLLLPTIFIPRQVTACPVKLPETLLALYRNSDAIYIGTYDKITEHEIVEDTAERIIVNTKRHFDISTTLKGEPMKLVALDETDYRYKNLPGATEESSEVAEAEVEAEQSEQDVPEEEDLYVSPVLNSGDLVLLFLKNDPDTGALNLTDYRDGVKKMTSREKLDAYEARIRELNTIFSGKKVDDASIVEWLVRCARDPLTRWEAAFEIYLSFQELGWREREKQEQEQQQAEGEAAEAEPAEAEEGSEASEEEAVEVEELDRSVYARLLTDAQKQELMNIIIEARPASDSKNANRLDRGDRVLIDVVSNWGDGRFARFPARPHADGVRRALLCPRSDDNGHKGSCVTRISRRSPRVTRTCITRMPTSLSKTMNRTQTKKTPKVPNPVSL